MEGQDGSVSVVITPRSMGEAYGLPYPSDLPGHTLKQDDVMVIIFPEQQQ